MIQQVNASPQFDPQQQSWIVIVSTRTNIQSNEIPAFEVLCPAGHAEQALDPVFS